MTENEIAKIIVDVAYHIHVKLGPGIKRVANGLEDNEMTNNEENPHRPSLE
ncbi:MAG: hypothetical protein L0220_33100 [Acidobacteria bacterium]|nr:hypothetical protein [Acidobacteriota bacterium]